MTEDVRHRARAGGIALDYQDARGKTVCISDEVLSDLLAAMGGGRERQHGQDARLPAVLVVTPVGGAVSVALPDLGAGIELEWLLKLEDGQSRTGRSCLDDMSRLVLSDVPLGYHTLVAPELEASCALVVTPGKCWLPDTLPDEKRRFGISLQLYLVRSKRNFGVGDFGDLARFAALAGQRGCDVIGVNPLHQMFLDAPEQASPYSPVSRYFLNILYIDLQALPEWSSAPVQSVVSSPEFLSALKQWPRGSAGRLQRGDDIEAVRSAGSVFRISVRFGPRTARRTRLLRRLRRRSIAPGIAVPGHAGALVGRGA
jgi:hypothetical protein